MYEIVVTCCDSEIARIENAALQPSGASFECVCGDVYVIENGQPVLYVPPPPEPEGEQ